MTDVYFRGIENIFINIKKIFGFFGRTKTAIASIVFFFSVNTFKPRMVY